MNVTREVRAAAGSLVQDTYVEQYVQTLLEALDAHAVKAIVCSVAQFAQVGKYTWIYSFYLPTLNYYRIPN